MKIRTERMVSGCSCGRVHRDEHGTRFFGVPAWVICLVIVVAGTAAMLAYTAAAR